MSSPDPVAAELSWRNALLHDGYCFVAGDAMRVALLANGDLSDWDAFAASWNALE